VFPFELEKEDYTAHRCGARGIDLGVVWQKRVGAVIVSGQMKSLDFWAFGEAVAIPR